MCCFHKLCTWPMKTIFLKLYQIHWICWKIIVFIDGTTAMTYFRSVCFVLGGKNLRNSRCSAKVNANHRLPSICPQSTGNLQPCCRYHCLKNVTFDPSLPWVLKMWMLFRVFSVIYWSSLVVKELNSAEFMVRTTEFGTPMTALILEHQQEPVL